MNFPAEAPDGCTGGGGLTPPILEYAHGTGCDSVTGGYVYRGVEFDAELGGTYFYADYCSGELWGARTAWRRLGQCDHRGHGHDLRPLRHLAKAMTVNSTWRPVPAISIASEPPAAPSEPDLTVNSVDGPLYGFLGGVINVASTSIQNQGSVSAGANAIGYYFTTDPGGQPNQTFSGSTCLAPAPCRRIHLHLCRHPGRCARRAAGRLV